MLEGRRVVVVVPAFDEEDRIADVVRRVPRFVDATIVVDDASRDRTAERARAADPERAVVLSHAKNRGVGAAIATGYERAVELGADVVAVMAGDGQMDPADLERVVRPVLDGVADYVKGNRQRHPRAGEMPAVRRTGNRVLGWISGRTLRLEGLGDSQCGYTAISSALVRKLPLGSLWPRYGYPNDLLAWVVARGGRVAEVPVRPVFSGQRSGLRAWHVLRMLALIGRGGARVRRMR